MRHSTIATLLFVPGDRPDRIAKAHASAADAIAVDLEDAVAHSQKDVARAAAVDAIAQLPPAGARIYVRVNATSTDFFGTDMQALTGCAARLEGIVLPMCETAEMVGEADRALHVIEASAGIRPGSLRIMPLLETAAGVFEARRIVRASARVDQATFGPADLSRQLSVTPSATGEELAVARSLVVLASAAEGAAAPIDGPWLDLSDTDGLRAATSMARRIGFGGKQVIHPAQVETVADHFAVDEQLLAWAAEVDRAFRDAESRGVSSIRLEDGTFVDYPVALRARDILRRNS